VCTGSVGDRRRRCGDVTEGLTPLTAAAQADYYEVVQMLLQHGYVVTRPHTALCDCDECVRVEKTQEVRYAQLDENACVNNYFFSHC